MTKLDYGFAALVLLAVAGVFFFSSNTNELVQDDPSWPSSGWDTSQVQQSSRMPERVPIGDPPVEEIKGIILSPDPYKEGPLSFADASKLNRAWLPTKTNFVGNFAGPLFNASELTCQQVRPYVKKLARQYPNEAAGILSCNRAVEDLYPISSEQLEDLYEIESIRKKYEYALQLGYLNFWILGNSYDQGLDAELIKIKLDSIRSWANENGFPLNEVYDDLDKKNGQKKVYGLEVIRREQSDAALQIWQTADFYSQSYKNHEFLYFLSLVIPEN